MTESNSTAVAPSGRRSVTTMMAEKYSMEAANFERTLLATVMPKNCTKENVAAFLIVASQYDLNPFTREIFAFEGQGGGVRPIVSIDGWAKMVNSHPQFNGCELIEVFDAESGAFAAVECRMYRRDRDHPIVIREYLDECKRSTAPWQTWPKRMLRHKAYIQGARLAFSFSGIEDEDELERTMEAQSRAEQYTFKRPATATIDMGKAREGVPQDPPGGQTLPPKTSAKTEPNGEHGSLADEIPLDVDNDRRSKQ